MIKEKKLFLDEIETYCDLNKCLRNKNKGIAIGLTKFQEEPTTYKFN